MAIALDAHRSFNRAARALGVSQPALTRGLLATLGPEYSMRYGPWLMRGQSPRTPTLCELGVDPACVHDVLESSPLAAESLWRETFEAERLAYTDVTPDLEAPSLLSTGDAGWPYLLVPFIAIAIVSWASDESAPCDIAPPEKRRTISSAGSTSSSGTGLQASNRKSNSPRKVIRRCDCSLTSCAYSRYASAHTASATTSRT